MKTYKIVIDDLLDHKIEQEVDLDTCMKIVEILIHASTSKK